MIEMILSRLSWLATYFAVDDRRPSSLVHCSNTLSCLR